MKILFAAVALVAMTAPLSLADGQQDYPPPDQQYQQPADPQQQPYPAQGGYEQPQVDPSQSYPQQPPDQQQGGYQQQPDPSQGGYQAGDAQPQGDDQADDDSDGGYSVDSVGQVRPGHKKKRTVGPPQQSGPPGPNENWGLPPLTGHTKEDWERYQQQNAAALARQKEFIDNNYPECPSMPHEDGQPEIDLHESCRIGITKEAERSREIQKKQTLDYATNEYGKCMQGCAGAGQICSSPYEEQWTHGHNDCRGEYDRCTAGCTDMYNVRVQQFGLPTK